MSQPVFGTSEASLVRAFQAIEKDLHALGDPWINDSVDAMRDNQGDLTAALLHDMTSWLIDRSTTIIMEGPEEAPGPLTKFGQAVVAASKLPNVRQPAENDGRCQEAELRLFKSLTFHDLVDTKDFLHEFRNPAVILLGEHDEPIGYEKSNGTPSTYMWDQATISTKRGQETVPADSFAYAQYSDDVEDVYYSSDASVIAVRANETNLQSFGLLRLSTRSYPSAVRTAMAHASAEMTPGLQKHVDAALSFTPKDVKQRVAQILATTDVPIIGKP